MPRAFSLTLLIAASAVLLAAVWTVACNQDDDQEPVIGDRPVEGVRIGNGEASNSGGSGSGDDDSDDDTGATTTDDDTTNDTGLTCTDICTANNAPIFIQCGLTAAQDIDGAIAECLSACDAVGDSFITLMSQCLPVFTDCETLLNCLGV